MASGQDNIDRAVMRYRIKASSEFSKGHFDLAQGIDPEIVIRRLRSAYRLAWREAVAEFPPWAKRQWANLINKS